MLKEFDEMSSEYGFRVVNASRTIGRVAADLRRAVARVIDGEKPEARTKEEEAAKALTVS